MSLRKAEPPAKAVLVSWALIPTRRGTQPGSREPQRSDQLLRGRTRYRCSQIIWRDVTDARTYYMAGCKYSPHPRLDAKNCGKVRRLQARLDLDQPSRPWSSLPGLNRTALPGGIFTSSPVRGLRPMPVFLGFTVKTPNRLSSILWVRPIPFFSDSKTVSTACSALTRLTPAPSSFASTAFTISSLIKRASAALGQMLEAARQVVKT